MTKYTLLNDRNQPVATGDTLTDYNGIQWTVESLEPPKVAGACGRVCVSRTGPRGGSYLRALFPQVFNALFVKGE